MLRKRSDPEPLEVREFRSPEEIDLAISKLQRRIKELEALDVGAAVYEHTGEDSVVRNNARDTILEIFGVNSPEFRDHKHIQLWSGPMYMGMSDAEIVQGIERGRATVIGILKGLQSRLAEKRADLISGAVPPPTTYFDRLNLHGRISEVSRDLFMDGHPWDAVFAAAKALVNYVKERSGRHDLDGAVLVR